MSSPALECPVGIVSVAGATALAPTLFESAFLHRRGSLGLRESALLDPTGASVTACTLPLIDPCLVGTPRLFELLECGLKELATSLDALDKSARLKVYLLLDSEYQGVLPEGGTRAEVVGAEVRLRLEAALGRRVPLTTLPGDVTAMAEALVPISAELNSGEVEVALVVALHSDIEPGRITELHATRRLFTDDNQDALTPGEACVMFTLTGQAAARRLGLGVSCWLRGLKTAYEKARPDNDESAFQALAMTFCFRAVAKELCDAGGKVGWMMSDLSRESFRISEYQAVLARCQDVFGMPQHHEFPGHAFGYLGAATFPLHVALCATAFRYGYSPAPYCVCLGGRDDGARAVLLISAQ
jgi:3-oxoacyl-[acyl-carrier-protein] synthase I